MFVQYLHEPAHMRAFVVAWKVHVHIDLRYGLLTPHVLVQHCDGVTNPFHTDLIDVDVSVIHMTLNILH